MIKKRISAIMAGSILFILKAGKMMPVLAVDEGVPKAIFPAREVVRAIDPHVSATREHVV